MSCTGPHAPTGLAAPARASGSGLAYASRTGLYTYSWKTEPTWRGTCRALELRLADGTSRTATFQFR